MDPRGHLRPESAHHHSGHRQAKDREERGRTSQQAHGFESRERERHWAQPDARHRNAHYSGPAARPEQYPYNYQQYPAYGYGPADYHRPQSRQGYEYPPPSQWDYRESYAYYDQDYYRGQHAQQDTGQWAHQDSWRADSYQEQGRDLHHHLSDYEETPSRDNEEVSSYHLGTLESSKASGLSSSSYELSQYMNGGEHRDVGPNSAAGPVPEASAPLKYSIPHAVVSFGPAGQLMRVAPGVSTQKNVSQVEIHSLEVILNETQEQQDMRNFPGPLTREDLHKVDAVEFAQQEAGACMKNDELQDKSSAALLWNLLILLCRQNGQMVGSDIAELLMQGSRPDGSWAPETPTLIDFSESAALEAPPAEKGDDLLTGDLSSFSPEASAKALQSYTQLLLAGRKKEALESAMSSGLWGHALFLASKMDNRSYTSVLTRFTGQLTASDPLQTLFQLLSGRIPAVATCCGNERVGDWRPHLAVMLSNETGDAAVQRRAIITMGDTLASRGLLHAAHVCYLTAGVPFGAFTRKAERLVLLGSSHRRPFAHFATNAAVRCTELYEYCQTLGDKGFSLPAFQVYKFVYACRLLDSGLSSQAFYYCEVVGQALLRHRELFYVLAGEVIKLSDRLRHSEGQFSEGGVSGAELEPDWLLQLRARFHSSQTGSYDCRETYQPEPQVYGLAQEERYPDDLHSEIQSPEPELLYYRGEENQESLLTRIEALSTETAPSSPPAPPPPAPAPIYTGPQHWPGANPPAPAPALAAPLPPPTLAPSQDFSYHNRHGAEVRGAAAHCSPGDAPPAAAGAGSSAGPGPMLGMDMSHQGPDQHSAQPLFQTSEQTNEQMKQDDPRGGWFSGWFKSKAKEDEQRAPAQTMPPPDAQFRPPPPPSMVSPNTFSAPPSAAGINPFSRKAGQQLG